MAELIKKQTMLNWVQKQVEAVTKKQVADSDGIFTREVLTTMQRDLSAFENAINAIPTTTEAEIRAKAIDEFAELLKKAAIKGAFQYKPDKNKPWCKELVYCKVVGTRKIDEIAEQLKEESE